jgi:mRNA-degrading endonuclease RelE of RelBE toxin-antitoxin system
MTDKISKELAKLSAKERQLVKSILLQIRENNTKGLKITKLKGHQNIYRVRKGRLRIIYQQHETIINVLTIERRSEKTYRDY